MIYYLPIDYQVFSIYSCLSFFHPKIQWIGPHLPRRKKQEKVKFWMVVLVDLLVRWVEFYFWYILPLVEFELNQGCHQQVVQLWVFMGQFWDKEHGELSHTKYLTGSKPSLSTKRG